MNTTPLKDEMAARVAHLDAPVSMRQAVDGKIRTTKRRRAGTALAGAGAVAALCAFAVVGTGGGSTAPLVPAGTVGSAAPSTSASTDGMPHRAIAPSPDDVVRDGLRYRARVADDTLVAAIITPEGDSRATLSWTPTSTQVSFSLGCFLPRDEARAKTRTVWLLVGGHRVAGSGCRSVLPSDGSLPTGSVLPGEPGQGFTELKVGRAETATVQVSDRRTGKPVSDAGVRVSAAVYQLGARRLVLDPTTGKAVAALPEVIENDGYRYRLAPKVVTGPESRATPLRAATPKGVPFLLTAGTVGTPDGGNATVKAQTSDPTGGSTSALTVSGRGDDGAAMGLGVTTTSPYRAGPAGSATLRLEGARPKTGLSLIAVYTLAD